jgi:hypothetical membrane protein
MPAKRAVGAVELAAERPVLDMAWFRRIFGAVAAACVMFVVFTTTAMLFYPGGARPIHSTHGYRFLLNSFSDLGQTRTQLGATNYPSMLLFSIGMLVVAVGAGVFFVAFARYFATHAASPMARRLNRAATMAGLVSAVFFAGVGLTPYNVLLPEHQIAHDWAFYLLLAAVLLEIAALRGLRSMPAALLWVNLAFVAALIGYEGALMFSPPGSTLVGDEIRVVAQKLIVYTAIGIIFSQALLIRAHLARPRAAYAAVTAHAHTKTGTRC